MVIGVIFDFKENTKYFFSCQSNWEVMNDLHQMDICTGPASTIDLSIPGICEGYLMKRRKYPLKGWHKVSPEYLSKLSSVFFLIFFKEMRKLCRKITELLCLSQTKKCVKKIVFLNFLAVVLFSGTSC